MLNTHARPSRDLRNNYRDIVELVKKQDQVIITNNGVGEAVVINMDVFAQFEDFLHRGFIYEELQKSKAKLNDPNTKRTSAANVFNKLKQKRESKELWAFE